MAGDLEGLDVIIVDDDPAVCETLAGIIATFYTYGGIHRFNCTADAIAHCQTRPHGIAIFIVDVFLGGETGFAFLDAIAEKFRSIYEDTIMITGNADDNVVNMCLAAEVNYLLQKPVRKYALQLAVRSIATKYIRFANTIQRDPEFARWVNGISRRYFAQMPRLSKDT
jgi:DNA-binding NarL/FixJ family response regulator